MLIKWIYRQSLSGISYDEAGEQKQQTVMGMAVGCVGLLLAWARRASLSVHGTIRRSKGGALSDWVGPLGPGFVGVCAPVIVQIGKVS